jgi:serine/threonine protein phosphatase PrpC
VADSATIPVLAAASLSDPGRVRTNNEDLPILDAERGVFGVIDGVGGHAAGELAAAIARDVILQRLARPLGAPAERVREAIAIANNEIFRRASSEPALAGMTCVVTLAVVADGRITIGHVGDSRLYKLRPSGLRKLTHDHSPVGEREDAREIGELEAMQHPRRHEVFRDVGSAMRDKDEPDYVEVIDDTLEDDAAIVVCSDGLSDMIPSTTIDRVVRLHAGDAAAVTTALVAAANDAGGRDNVTVVYAEMPGFASAVKASPPPVAAGATSSVADAGVVPTRRSPGGRVLGGRATWFVLGAVLGVLGALLLAWRLSTDVPVGGRTIAAAPHASETVGALGAAVQAARAGDVIRLEPGTYAESVVVPDGVSLRARVPGSAVFVRPPGAAGEWVALVAAGDGGTISGLRITSTAAAPVQVGLRIAGQGRSIELLQMEGPVTAGVDILEDASATLQGSHFAVAGPAVVLASGSQLDATGNAFVAPAASVVATTPVPRRTTGGTRGAPSSVVPGIFAVHLEDGARVVLNRNVFAGFGATPIKGLSDADREPVRTANVVVSPDRSTR